MENVSNNKKNKIVVYVPSGAKLNIENGELDPPITKYNKRKKIIDLDTVKKITGGLYGKKE